MHGPWPIPLFCSFSCSSFSNNISLSLFLVSYFCQWFSISVFIPYKDCSMYLVFIYRRRVYEHTRRISYLQLLSCRSSAHCCTRACTSPRPVLSIHASCYCCCCCLLQPLCAVLSAEYCCTLVLLYVLRIHRCGYWLLRTPSTAQL